MDAPSRNGDNGRDGSGRFKAGNAGGPGNPFARRVAALRSALVNALADEDMQSLVRGLVEKAKTGDVAATKLLLAYTVGRPSEVVDPDRLEQDEHSVLCGRPSSFDRNLLSSRDR